MKTTKTTKDKVKAILGYEPQIDMSKHSRIRRIWTNMKSRCYNSNNNAYKYYGQKGICVCNEWLQFPNFVAWAFISGYEDNLSIDRINGNGNYEPQNCRWVDNYTQANNTSRNYHTELGTIGELSRKYNINYGTLTNRVKRAKMNISEAVSIGKNITTNQLSNTILQVIISQNTHLSKMLLMRFVGMVMFLEQENI